jgi:hypothetical protein
MKPCHKRPRHSAVMAFSALDKLYVAAYEH